MSHHYPARRRQAPYLLLSPSERRKLRRDAQRVPPSAVKEAPSIGVVDSVPSEVRCTVYRLLFVNPDKIHLVSIGTRIPWCCAP